MRNMAEAVEFSSPLVGGAKFAVPAEGWNDLRTLIEGRATPGLTDGRHHSHLVSRWRTDGGITADRRVFPDDNGDIQVSARPPRSREAAAQLGAAMIYAARSGRTLKVGLERPERPFSYYDDLSLRACEWAVQRFRTGGHRPVRPSVANWGQVEISFPGHNGTKDNPRTDFTLAETPEVISQAYAYVVGLPTEAGESVFAAFVGAPDFEMAQAAFKEAEAAATPFEAAHIALGVLLARDY